MYQSLDLFQTAAAMAQHAGQRQALTARNVANADTPGYRAEHLPSFADSWRDHGPADLRATRPGHIGGGSAGFSAATMLGQSEPAPNGNAVSIEDEMLNAVNIAREHNRALTIYRHGMTILRASLGR